jgi:hypothetical protein
MFVGKIIILMIETNESTKRKEDSVELEFYWKLL